ncbi:hypothetical protein [Halorhodospira halochloris]|uniref:hypothetical protein n=1 Tax=Halorhodospira halochloris TaxID=1052 RepID=UPI001EE89690|nr:hypothetical protein [Halorhodospira halochloris]MCG5548518.1 hypothetical protein [Halorhodospira halochloris]
MTKEHKQIRLWRSPQTLSSAWQAALLPALMLPTMLHAAGQYKVEDADLITPNSIESEIWHSDKDKATFANATTRLQGNWQVTAEVESLRNKAQENYVLEGKWLLRSLDPHGYGVGLFGGFEYDRDNEEIAESFLLVPYTEGFANERVFLHVNLGGVYDHDDNDADGFWGLAVEGGLGGPFEGVAEIFSTGGDDPAWQTGLRAVIFDDQVTVDASWIENEESGEGGWAFGVGIQPVQF